MRPGLFVLSYCFGRVEMIHIKHLRPTPFLIYKKGKVITTATPDYELVEVLVTFLLKELKMIESACG